MALFCLKKLIIKHKYYMYETPKKLPVSQSKSKSSEDALLSTGITKS